MHQHTELKLVLQTGQTAADWCYSECVW